MEAATWAITDLDDDGHRVAFVVTFLDGTRNHFLIDVPAGRPIVTDEMGRLRTVSGRWRLPVREVDGEWQPRPEDPADPWLRAHQPRDVDAAVDAAVRAYLDRQEQARAGA